MEDKEGQPHRDLSEAATVTVTVTVTPTLGETVISDRPTDAPVVALGDHHCDLSDDDKSESADSLIDLSSPILPTANATLSTAKGKGRSPS
jgi:hypothetical protein